MLSRNGTEKGQALVETLLCAALVSVLILAAVGQLQSSFKEAWQGLCLWFALPVP